MKVGKVNVVNSTRNRFEGRNVQRKPKKSTISNYQHPSYNDNTGDEEASVLTSLSEDERKGDIEVPISPWEEPTLEENQIMSELICGGLYVSQHSIEQWREKLADAKLLHEKSTKRIEELASELAESQKKIQAIQRQLSVVQEEMNRKEAMNANLRQRLVKTQKRNSLLAQERDKKMFATRQTQTQTNEICPSPSRKRSSSGSGSKPLFDPRPSMLERFLKTLYSSKSVQTEPVIMREPKTFTEKYTQTTQLLKMEKICQTDEKHLKLTQVDGKGYVLFCRKCNCEASKLDIDVILMELRCMQQLLTQNVASVIQSSLSLMEKKRDEIATQLLQKDLASKIIDQISVKSPRYTKLNSPFLRSETDRKEVKREWLNLTTPLRQKPRGQSSSAAFASQRHGASPTQESPRASSENNKFNSTPRMQQDQVPRHSTTGNIVAMKLDFNAAGGDISPKPGSKNRRRSNVQQTCLQGNSPTMPLKALNLTESRPESFENERGRGASRKSVPKSSVTPSLLLKQNSNIQVFLDENHDPTSPPLLSARIRPSTLSNLEPIHGSSSNLDPSRSRPKSALGKYAGNSMVSRDPESRPCRALTVSILLGDSDDDAEEDDKLKTPPIYSASRLNAVEGSPNLQHRVLTSAPRQRQQKGQHNAPIT